MTEPRKKKSATKERTERRFVPAATHTSRAAAFLGMAGSLMLGAGVYAQWVQEAPVAYAPVLVTAGALGLGGGLWLGSATSFPVRVGNSGVAIERGSEMTRLLWCDMEEIRIDGADLAIRSASLTMTIPLGAHPRAVAYILDEAERRLPKLVRVDDAKRKTLPKVGTEAGHEVPVASDQVAGRRCAVTKRIISFERDARLCSQCAQVYYKDNVPKTCVTCGTDLAGKTTKA